MTAPFHGHAVRTAGLSPGAQTRLPAALAAAALVELLILRSFTRTAVHIPGLEALAGPYQIIAGTGRYAYFVSSALLLVCLPLLARACWRSGTGASRATASALVMFAFAATAWRAGIGSPLAIDAATIAIVAVGSGAAFFSLSGSSRLPVALFAAAFVLSGGHATLQAAAQVGTSSVDSRWLLTIAEVAGLAFALVSPLLARPTGRLPWAVGLSVGIVTFAMLLVNGSTLRILLLWNQGLSGTLPAVTYGAAAGALALTSLSALKRKELAIASGFLLLLAGGFGLHNTYQTGLVVIGLALLTLAAAAKTLETRLPYATAVSAPR